MFTLTFWKDAAERSIATAAQVLAAIITVDGLGVEDVDWQRALSITALAALGSIVKALAAAKRGPNPDASFVNTHIG